MKIQVTDKRIQALVVKAAGTDTEIRNLDEFATNLVKATVRECMRQLAMPVDVVDPQSMAIVKSQWDYLSARFGVKE